MISLLSLYISGILGGGGIESIRGSGSCASPSERRGMRDCRLVPPGVPARDEVTEKPDCEGVGENALCMIDVLPSASDGAK